MNKAEHILVEKDSFIRAIALIEDHKDSFLIYADSKPNSSKKVNIYCLRLSDDIKEEKRSVRSPNSKGFYAMTYNPARKLLALGNERGEIHISEIDCKKLKSFTGIKFSKVDRIHKGIVKALAFSRNGRYLASVSLDNTIMLWDIQNKKVVDMKSMVPVLTIDSKQKILSVLFDANEEYMIFSDDRNLHICPTRPEVFIEKLCKRKKRELSDVEWNDYIGNSIKKEEIIICSQAGEK